MTIPIGGRGLEWNPNELSRILLAESLALDGALAVDGPIAAWGTSQDLAMRNGRSYSDKAPGLAFAAAPIARAIDPLLAREEGSRYAAYEPLRHLLTWCLAALPAAAIPFIVLGASPAGERGARAWLALMLGLATPLLTYGTLFFSHVASGALVAVGWTMMRAAGREGGGGRPRSRTLLAGLLSGSAVATEYAAAIPAVILLIWTIRRSGPAAGAAFVCGAALGSAPALLYHHLAFGSVWTTGYAFKTDPSHAALHARGFFGLSAPSSDALAGVLVSARRGILLYCPLLLLIPWGFWRMVRRREPQAVSLAVVFALWMLFAASFPDWEGGWCAASRHLVPLVPLALLPLARAVADLQPLASGRITTWLLAGGSLAGSLLSLSVTPLFPEIFDAPLGQVALLGLRDGAAMPSLVADLTPLGRLPAALLWAAASVAAAALAAARASRRGAGLPAAVSLLAGAALAVLLHGAASPAPTAEQTRARAIVLDRIGYHELARRIDAESRR